MLPVQCLAGYTGKLCEQVRAGDWDSVIVTAWKSRALQHAPGCPTAKALRLVNSVVGALCRWKGPARSSRATPAGTAAP